MQPPSDPEPRPESRQPDSAGTNSGDGSGMGPTPSGPSFAPGSWQPQWSEPVGPPPAARPDPTTYVPKRSRLPAVITAVAVGMVALVVAVASLFAYRADQQVAPPPRPTVPTPIASTAADSIEFTTSSGGGRLTIVDHSWSAARTDPGSVLQVSIRIECSSGTVDYDPFDFQTFDGAGNLYDLAPEEVNGEILGVGLLQPGESVTGVVAFVMPRGEVTLLMSDDATSITALKVPA